MLSSPVHVVAAQAVFQRFVRTLRGTTGAVRAEKTLLVAVAKGVAVAMHA